VGLVLLGIQRGGQVPTVTIVGTQLLSSGQVVGMGGPALLAANFLLRRARCCVS
jgi:hypothetical protein